MTAKESEHFMKREEFKLRKWQNIKSHYDVMAEQALQYKQDANYEKDDKKAIFFMYCYSTFKMISEKAEKKIEKWTKRAKETNG